MNKYLTFIILTSLTALVSGCDSGTGNAATNAATDTMPDTMPAAMTAPVTQSATATSQDPIMAAVSNSARSEADRALDDKRKPAEVLAFFGIAPGMRVLDVFGGGGYYAEIMSYLVGPTGGVTLYNNNPWDAFVKDAVTARLADNRLPNVDSLILAPVDLGQANQKYDAAIFILGMHDIYYEDLENGWPLIDKAVFLKNIYDLLEDGAVLGVIDHNAASGSDPVDVGERLHRIDPAVIIRDLEAAGFSLEAQSDLLSHPDDDHTALVFNPELRWKSDRSVLRFRK